MSVRRIAWVFMLLTLVGGGVWLATRRNTAATIPYVPISIIL